MVAVPSVGALVPGWILIIPKRHVLSLAGLAAYEKRSFVAELHVLKRQYTERFGSVTLFEHGPALPGGAVGCSIDHAHMHIVPTGGLDLVARAQAYFPGFTWRKIDGLGAVEPGVPYLFVEPPVGSAWVATGNDIPSQALRRVVAAELGCTDEYDWKAFPRFDTVRETLVRIGSPPRSTVSEDLQNHLRNLGS
jgi:ATP adenylyltransferase